MSSRKKAIVEIIASMMLSAIGVLVAGIILGGIVRAIELIPGLLALVPALMNMRGCIAGALAMRIGSAFHLGLLEGPAGRKEIKRNIYAALSLTTVTAIPIGILGDAFCRALGLPTVGPLLMVEIAVSTAILASIIMISLTIGVATYSAAKGLDPDNVTVPVVTTLGDVITVTCLILVLVLLRLV